MSKKTKRYYWLKLKDTFFNELDIKRLMKKENGERLTIIYLKMQLLSIKNDACINLDNINYSDIEELYNDLSLLLDENLELIKDVFEYCIKYKLIENINGNYYMTKVEVGTESESAERVRKYREKQANTKFTDEKMLQCNENVTLEKEKEKEKDIDKKKINKKENKKTYGTYNNVFLLDSEYDELKKIENDIENVIEFLSEYIEMKDYKANNHYLAIKKWVIDAYNQDKVKNNIKKNFEQRKYDYDFNSFYDNLRDT